MQYELERRLNEKADEWKLSQAQTEIGELKNNVNRLKEKIEYLEGINSNRYYALERFFVLIAEHPQFSDLQNEIYVLRGNL
jgi:hypothetical protein